VLNNWRKLSRRTAIHKGRKKRYIIATSIAVVSISIALYNAAETHPYKNSKTWNFDSYQEKSMLGKMLSIGTNSEDKGTWVIKSDELAPSKPNLLAKLSNNETGSAYHLLIMPEGVYTNFEASVKFKITSGEKEQAAGLIIRFQDMNHYIVIIADAMNHRFSLARAEAENLIFTQDVNYNITIGQWHAIMVQVGSQGIAAYLDGKQILLRSDQHYITGQIGLWTKGDTEAYFDDLKIAY
jgi:hypothetical protein